MKKTPRIVQELMEEEKGEKSKKEINKFSVILAIMCMVLFYALSIISFSLSLVALFFAGYFTRAVFQQYKESK